ncbi:VOC family protein [Entomomonas sp. E2T0]|uniref:VOC family protein n=1 Tax=Entomomonas sp. E2T0 TaxID=2930213 RepID=UPI0022284C05|nr:VOC family protein [Entomomonas sp. E2T0]UYZ84209.1 VOC family protein [Entomomonas sp. E2T0]
MLLFKPNSIILYVSDIQLSTQFYTNILGQQPIEAYKEFSVFTLNENIILGLQTKEGIDPEPTKHFGGFEICLSDVTKQQVDTIYKQWQALHIPILLEPTQLEFGYTFVALDPDGHRLRVCATDTTNIQ